MHSRVLLAASAIALFLATLLLYKLATLVGGMSAAEMVTAKTPVGWHGIWLQPLELPLKAVRSVVFFLREDHGQFLTRLPNALFGAAAIVTLGWVVSSWHNRRTTMLTMLLFATSAWVLHVSRVATSDVLYLWALPMLLLVQILLHRYGTNRLAWYGILSIWGILLYIPGLVWLIAAQAVLQRKQIKQAWSGLGSWVYKAFSVLVFSVWLPLLIVGLTRTNGLMTWLGLPTDFASPLTVLRQIAAVPFHLLVIGPQYPDIWLGRLPILDAFTLMMCLLGAYFYASHWRSSRSRALGVTIIIGIVLIGLGGPVKLSLLVPILYVGVATGIAYILQTWLKVFPRNPLARGLGIGLVCFAVALSCVHNLRAYFVAWPHNDTTKTTFRYHL